MKQILQTGPFKETETALYVNHRNNLKYVNLNCTDICCLYNIKTQETSPLFQLPRMQNLYIEYTPHIR
jgi:hypothetical protein